MSALLSEATDRKLGAVTLKYYERLATSGISPKIKCKCSHNCISDVGLDILNHAVRGKHFH